MRVSEAYHLASLPRRPLGLSLTEPRSSCFRLQVAETHFSLLDLDGPTKRDLPLHPVSLYPVKLSSLLSCEWGKKIVLPSAVSFAFCSSFSLFSLSTEESSVVLLCMYC